MANPVPQQILDSQQAVQDAFVAKQAADADVQVKDAALVQAQHDSDASHAGQTAASSTLVSRLKAHEALLESIYLGTQPAPASATTSTPPQ